ncbi:unnamed protein product [Chrysoparadoxa australica]
MMWRRKHGLRYIAVLLSCVCATFRCSIGALVATRIPTAQPAFIGHSKALAPPPRTSRPWSFELDASSLFQDDRKQGGVGSAFARALLRWLLAGRKHTSMAKQLVIRRHQAASTKLVRPRSFRSFRRTSRQQHQNQQQRQYQQLGAMRLASMASMPGMPGVGSAAINSLRGLASSSSSAVIPSATARGSDLEGPGGSGNRNRQPERKFLDVPTTTSNPYPGGEYGSRRSSGRISADLALLADDSEDGDDQREYTPLSSRCLQWAFHRIIRRNARKVEGLNVKVSAKSNRRALSGNLQTVGVSFQQLVLKPMQLSGGANMTITGVDLKVLLLLFRRFRAFKRPFEVSGDYVFTSSDLIASPLIKSIVQNIINASLRNLEAFATDPTTFRKAKVTVLRVSVKGSKLVIDGEAEYGSTRVPFTARTGVGLSKKGHVVYFKDSEAFWDSVGGRIGLPLVALNALDVDIGDNTRIDALRIANGQMAVRARFVLSPIPPLMVANVSKRAVFRYDVGERLSLSFGFLLDSFLPKLWPPRWSGSRKQITV